MKKYYRGAKLSTVSEVLGSHDTVKVGITNNGNLEHKSMKFKSETSIKTLIPYTASDKQAYKNVEFEPDPLTVLNKLIPQLMKALIYNAYLSAKSSEEAARKNAMNSATSNANELDEKLSLIYNKNRQSAITQEITEIVAGANAL